MYGAGIWIQIIFIAYCRGKKFKNLLNQHGVVNVSISCFLTSFLVASTFTFLIERAFL